VNCDPNIRGGREKGQEAEGGKGKKRLQSVKLRMQEKKGIPAITQKEWETQRLSGFERKRQASKRTKKGTRRPGIRRLSKETLVQKGTIPLQMGKRKKPPLPEKKKGVTEVPLGCRREEEGNLLLSEWVGEERNGNLLSKGREGNRDI